MKGPTVILRCAVALLGVAVLAAISAIAAVTQDDPGAIYVLTNQTANSVLLFARAADGTLSFSGNFATGGAGAGTGVDPLGSQGSLVLGRWHRRLFAVNAGSNDVSVFAVHGLNLRLLDRVPSGGTMPVSVAVHENLVYVVNAGGTPNIQGFLVEPSSGHLIQIPGSSQPLPGGASASPGQIGISPDGDVLLVTEKGTNQIDTWTLTDEGLPVNGKVIASHGAVPFGFTFVRRDVALVTEAKPSAVSSYQTNDDGTLELLSGTVLDNGAANCWIEATKNNRYAFVTNTGSGTISSYLISQDGSLSLLNATAAVTGPGTAPIDFALSNDSHFLFVRLGTKGTVAGFPRGKRRQPYAGWPHKRSARRRSRAGGALTSTRNRQLRIRQPGQLQTPKTRLGNRTAPPLVRNCHQARRNVKEASSRRLFTSPKSLAPRRGISPVFSDSRTSVQTRKLIGQIYFMPATFRDPAYPMGMSTKTLPVTATSFEKIFAALATKRPHTRRQGNALTDWREIAWAALDRKNWVTRCGVRLTLSP